MPLRQIIVLIGAILVFGTALAPASANAAEAANDRSPEFYSRSWLVDDGLPSNAANDVLEDNDGFLWISTIDGLVRFDGFQFKPFNSPLISKGTAKNIRSMAMANDGGLLIIPATGGVVQFKDGRFTPHPAASGLEHDQILGVFAERSGAVWTELAGGRVRRWQNGEVREFGPEDGLSERSRISFAEDNQGVVWLASGTFLAAVRDEQLDPVTFSSRGFAVVAASPSGGIWACKGSRLFRLQGTETSVISSNVPWAALGEVVRVMHEDRQGALWIGTAGYGLYRFADNEFSRVENVHSQITSILDDAEGNIWVTTYGGGLTRLRPKLFRLYDTTSGLLEDVSDSVAADSHGTVWAANRSGGVASIRDGQVEALRLQESGHRFRAYVICPDDLGGVWASEGDLYRFDPEPPHQIQVPANNPTDIHVLFKSRSGDIWVGGESGLFGRYAKGQLNAFKAEPNFPGRQIRCIAEDTDGQLWIGTELGSLYRWSAGKFTEYGASNGIPRAAIRAIYADTNDVVWIGTGNGLAIGQNGLFSQITSSNGLPDDRIASITEDSTSRLWFSSRSGIFHAQRQNLLNFAAGKVAEVRCITFGKSEGLVGISCLGSVQPMACKTSDGRLWFATQQGVLGLEALRVKVNHRPPPVFIDQVLANDVPLASTNFLRVPPRCRKVEFRFAALSYVAPEKVRIRYRLAGVDSDWLETTDHRNAIYNALQPGRYHFHVVACNSDGVWNSIGATVSFVVLPTWWQTWWFQSFALLLSVSALIVAVRHWSQRRLKLRLERLEQQHAIERERMRIARDLHDDLGATVTQVGLMVEDLSHSSPADPQWNEQSSVISRRVRMLARDLDAVVWSVNPSNDKLNQLAGYLSQFFLESLRRSPIRPRLEVQDGIPDQPVKPELRHHLFMVVKEAINNIVKHSHATEATLAISVTGGAFEVRVLDNGRGFAPEAAAQSTRSGLRNMRARAAEMGCQFEMTSQPDGGTLVRISIPLAKQIPPA